MRQNKIQIGDYVAVIDEEVKGRVIAVDTLQITIEDEDGFERHYSMNELVLYGEALEKDDSKVPVKEKQKIVSKTKSQETVRVVDLHNTTRIKNKSLILKNQLQKFQLNLNNAIRSKQQSIVFIHGVGEGILKSNLERLLRKNNISFSEASYQKYGYGAMEVFLKQTTKPLTYRAD